jgi:tetratricopeptide (TPR) repeat protein
MSVGRNEPCPCGSGKKFKLCHGSATDKQQSSGAAQTTALLIQAQQLLVRGDHAHAAGLLRRVVTIDPSNVDAQHFLGMATAFAGRLSEGLALIQNSLVAQPSNPVFHINLSFWLSKTGNINAAMEHLVRALLIKPDYHDARYQLAKLAMERHRYALAKHNLEVLLNVEPDNPELRYRMAETLLRLKEHTAMEREYRALIARAPQNVELHMKLAEGLRETGRDDEARAEYEAILAIEPANVEARYCIASIEERRHHLEKSERWLSEGLVKHPNDASLHLGLARVRRRQGRMDEALEHLRLVETATSPGEYQVQAFYETGSILDKLQHHDDAFEAFDRANAADRVRLTDPDNGTFYDKNQNKAWLETLRSFYTHAQLVTLRPYLPPAPNPQPLFIVGFPRSGTTLTEQMLSAHPNIHAGDELSGLLLIEEYAAAQLMQSRQSYPTCLADVTRAGRQDSLLKLRDYYLHIADESHAIDPAKAYFTDKMPLNETHLGLIKLLFPESPIVHVVRHPLDIMLSCYTNQLYHGNKCALSLETLAFHFIETWKLVDHYTAELDLRYTRIRYEDLIQNPEDELRRLLGFIGEPWDARCLDFHKSGRVARTASYAQVSQPLYRSSQERWRAYRKYLAPIVPMLAPLIERLGYSLD